MNLLYDLGAHWGESIDYFSKHLNNLDSWDVISVEASSISYEKLKNKAEQYQNLFHNISLINAFVYHKDSNIEFIEYTDDFNSAGSTYSKTKFENNSKKKPEYANLSHNILHPEIFNIVTSYKDNLDKYDEIIIKMDIEGAEYDVLPSLIDVISVNHTRNMYIEFHDNKLNIAPIVSRRWSNVIKNLGIQVRELNNILQ